MTLFGDQGFLNSLLVVFSRFELHKLRCHNHVLSAWSSTSRLRPNTVTNRLFKQESNYNLKASKFKDGIIIFAIHTRFIGNFHNHVITSWTVLLRVTQLQRDQQPYFQLTYFSYIIFHRPAWNSPTNSVERLIWCHYDYRLTIYTNQIYKNLII